jgi:hypothetical protein
LKLLATPSEPNYVHLVWVIRRVTSRQAKYIRMFYGEDALDAVSERDVSEIDPGGPSTQSSSQA